MNCYHHQQRLEFQVPNFQLFIASNQVGGECFSPHGCLSCGGSIVVIVISPTQEERVARKTIRHCGGFHGHKCRRQHKKKNEKKEKEIKILGRKNKKESDGGVSLELCVSIIVSFKLIYTSQFTQILHELARFGGLGG